MARIPLNDVRAGSTLLGKLIAEVDKRGNKNGRVTQTELTQLSSQLADATAKTLLKDVFTKAKAGRSTNPTVAEMNKALSEMVSTVAKADTNRSGTLNDSEQQRLSAGHKRLVAFGSQHKRSSLEALFGGVVAMTDVALGTLASRSIDISQSPDMWEHVTTMSANELPAPIRSKLTRALDEGFSGYDDSASWTRELMRFLDANDQTVGYVVYRDAYDMQADKRRSDVAVYNLRGIEVWTDGDFN